MPLIISDKIPSIYKAGAELYFWNSGGSVNVIYCTSLSNDITAVECCPTPFIPSGQRGYFKLSKKLQEDGISPEALRWLDEIRFIVGFKDSLSRELTQYYVYRPSLHEFAAEDVVKVVRAVEV